MKKFLNDAVRAVDDAAAGFVAAHADLVRLDADHRLVLRRDPLPAGRVALVSGGGSGHEPLHAGFVGDGMLAGAVLGDFFASPTTDQVLAAVRAVDAGGGVLLIVKNYTGDVLNFRLAAELAEDLGVRVRSVVVDDDVAVGARGDRPGRRGTGATVFVEKILGAQAARGASLDELVTLGERVVDASRSLGLALTSCTTPMAGRPTFDLGADEVEFGVGIHGEAGARRVPMATSAQLARDLVTQLVPELPSATPVLVLTNGFGATPPSELYTLHADVVGEFAAAGVRVERHLVGSYVTSLDMAGASVSVLALDDELTALWDAPVRTPALERAQFTSRPADDLPAPSEPLAATASTATGAGSPAAGFVAAWIARAAERLDAEVSRLTDLDAARGDADHGVNMQRGFAAAASAVSQQAPATAQDVLLAASDAVRRAVGGTSGPLWSMALRRMGKAAGDVEQLTPHLLAQMLDAAVAGVRELGGAEPGEGTMLDALGPAAHAARSAGGALDEAIAAAASAAERGADDTAGRVATKGRAAYLGERSVGTPDPGAVSAAIVVGALAG